jgi:hypothetical protein
MQGPAAVGTMLGAASCDQGLHTRVPDKAAVHVVVVAAVGENEARAAPGVLRWTPPSTSRSPGPRPSPIQAVSAAEDVEVARTLHDAGRCRSGRHRLRSAIVGALTRPLAVPRTLLLRHHDDERRLPYIGRGMAQISVNALLVPRRMRQPGDAQRHTGGTRAGVEVGVDVARDSGL